MHDDTSFSSVYTTACNSVHLMPEALLALLAVSWGVSKLHRHTKSRTKKRSSSLDLLVLAVANGLMLQEMARLWQCGWTMAQLRAAAAELARACLALGVVEWSSQTLAGLLKWHGATWLVGRAMADVLALSSGVSEPDLERIKREAPLIVARAAESEKLDWQAFLQQGRQWLTSQAA